MSSAKEYRQFADECMAWAKQAKTDYEREIYLKMAQDWLRAAVILDPSTTPIPPSDADATPLAPVRLP